MVSKQYQKNKRQWLIRSFVLLITLGLATVLFPSNTRQMKSSQHASSAVKLNTVQTREIRNKEVKKYIAVASNQDKLKEDKLKEDRLREAKLKQDKLKKDKLKEVKLKQDKLREAKLKEDKLREAKLKEEKSNKEKLKEAKLKEEKLKEEKSNKEKSKEDKLKENKLKEGKLNEEKLKEEKLKEEKSKVTTKKVQSGGHCNEMINLSICANKTRYKIEDMLKTDDKKNVVRTAQKISSKYGMVMMTFMNKAFVPFLTNWMCHTKSMVDYSQVLVLVTDKAVHSEITAKYPSLTVVLLSIFKEINTKQRYCSAGFMRMGIYRTRLVNWIIQENIPVFLFELDAMWKKNPIPFVTSKKEYDLTIIPTYEKSFELAIGFYYVRNTTRLKQFWMELDRRLDSLMTMFSCLDNEEHVRAKDNDQIVLKELIIEHYGNVIVYFLPLNRFLDGKWYFKPNVDQLKNAFILNFNFVIGVDEKIQRAKKFGHWFVADDNVTCISHMNKTTAQKPGRKEGRK